MKSQVSLLGEIDKQIDDNIVIVWCWKSCDRNVNNV